MKLLLIPDPSAPNGEDALCREIASRAAARGHTTTIKAVPNGPLDSVVKDLTASGFPGDADTVIVNNLQPAAMAAARAAARKVVVRLVDSYEEESPEALAEIQRTVFLADLLLVPNAHMEDVVRKWSAQGNGSSPRVLVRRVPYAYDKIRAKEISLVTLRATRPSGFPLIAASPLTESNRRGLETLISAISRLRLDCHLTLVGKGPLEGRLKDFAKQSVATDKVSILEPMNHGKLMEFFRAAKVYVDPSGNEGFPMLTLHALSEGCPVIVSDKGGSAELIENGKNGLSFPFGDAVALSESIMTLSSEQGLSIKLIEGGVQTVEGHSWDATVASIFEALGALGEDE